MSTTITYKGSTLTTLSNETKKLNTSGMWLEDDITIQDQGGGDVLIVDTPDSHGGTVREITTQGAVNLQNVKNYTLTSSSEIITPDAGYDGFRSIQVTSSEREDLTEPKDVDFIDYDGRLIYSYTVDEFMELTALPENPVNYGLIAQGWNWTLEDAQDFVGKYGALVIGQSYTTDNGRTRLYIKIPYSSTLLTTQLALTSTVAGSPTIYWGDGTTSTWSGGANANFLMSHTYETSGSYMIEIEVTNGEISYFGKTNANNSLLGGNEYVGSWLQKVEIGDHVIRFAQNVFKYMRELKTVSIPNTLIAINDYDESLFHLGALSDKGIVFPMGLTTNRYRAFWSSYSNIRYVSIPKSMKNIYIYTYPNHLRKFVMADMEPYSGTSNTVRFYSVPQLTHFVLMGTFTNIVTDTCRGSRIKKLFIPASVTSIAATAFQGNGLLEEIHLYPETPPSLANTNAFGSQTSATNTCIFYVPYSDDHSILNAYKTATNWSTFASKMQEEPQS